ncbi:unnamed protein product [Acanthosepion pharaonis]|uniref:Uncharacterized protein n=1 Tax=Acanthosepion pharaonis TaxID=158019 RepID=A0A812CT03_ACAPH|nr:unnamed protein product [Sepia pharaonis]
MEANRSHLCSLPYFTLLALSCPTGLTSTNGFLSCPSGLISSSRSSLFLSLSIPPGLIRSSLFLSLSIPPGLMCRLTALISALCLISPFWPYLVPTGLTSTNRFLSRPSGLISSSCSSLFLSLSIPPGLIRSSLFLSLSIPPGLMEANRSHLCSLPYFTLLALSSAHLCFCPYPFLPALCRLTALISALCLISPLLALSCPTGLTSTNGFYLVHPALSHLAAHLCFCPYPFLPAFMEANRSHLCSLPYFTLLALSCPTGLTSTNGFYLVHPALSHLAAHLCFCPYPFLPALSAHLCFCPYPFLPALCRLTPLSSLLSALFHPFWPYLVLPAFTSTNGFYLVHPALSHLATHLCFCPYPFLPALCRLTALISALCLISPFWPYLVLPALPRLMAFILSIRLISSSHSSLFLSLSIPPGLMPYLTNGFYLVHPALSHLVSHLCFCPYPFLPALCRLTALISALCLISPFWPLSRPSGLTSTNGFYLVHPALSHLASHLCFCPYPFLPALCLTSTNGFYLVHPALSHLAAHLCFCLIHSSRPYANRSHLCSLPYFTLLALSRPTGLTSTNRLLSCPSGLISSSRSSLFLSLSIPPPASALFHPFWPYLVPQALPRPLLSRPSLISSSAHLCFCPYPFLALCYLCLCLISPFWTYLVPTGLLPRLTAFYLVHPALSHLAAHLCFCPYPFLPALCRLTALISALCLISPFWPLSCPTGLTSTNGFYLVHPALSHLAAHLCFCPYPFLPALCRLTALISALCLISPFWPYLVLPGLTSTNGFYLVHPALSHLAAHLCFCPYPFLPALCRLTALISALCLISPFWPLSCPTGLTSTNGFLSCPSGLISSSCSSLFLSLSIPPGLMPYLSTNRFYLVHPALSHLAAHLCFCPYPFLPALCRLTASSLLSAHPFWPYLVLQALPRLTCFYSSIRPYSSSRSSLFLSYPFLPALCLTSTNGFYLVHPALSHLAAHLCFCPYPFLPALCLTSTNRFYLVHPALSHLAAHLCFCPYPFLPALCLTSTNGFYLVHPALSHLAAHLCFCPYPFLPALSANLGFSLYPFLPRFFSVSRPICSSSSASHLFFTLLFYHPYLVFTIINGNIMIDTIFICLFIYLSIYLSIYI